MLIDAPSVLGRRRRREMDERHTLGGIKAAFACAAGIGRFGREPVDVSAHILPASVNEVALMIARADDPDDALAAGERAVAHLLDSLLGPA